MQILALVAGLWARRPRFGRSIRAGGAVLAGLLAADLVLFPLVGAAAAPASLAPTGRLGQPQGLCFQTASFCITDTDLQAYFQARGGVDTFGLPVSRVFPFLGCPVQFFQRLIMQKCPGQGVALLNMLDPELFPYTRVNGSVFPGPDAQLKSATPQVNTPEYAGILDFVRSNAPDSVAGQPVSFGQTFLNRGGLDILGPPISRPQADPTNPNFIYQRFQRVVLHYRAGIGTEPLLLADYLKQVLLGPDRAGANLPGDLRQDAQGSRYFAQYCPGGTRGLCRPDALPGTDLTGAFDPLFGGSPTPTSTPTGTVTVTPTSTPTVTPTPSTGGHPVIPLGPDALASLAQTLTKYGLTTARVNVARTATFVLPKPGAVVTQVAPLATASTASADDLTKQGANVAVGVLRAGRDLPLNSAGVPTLPAGTYLVTVRSGRIVFVGSSGKDVVTGLAADIRVLSKPLKAPQTIVTYKDVCFGWGQTQVCTQPSPIAGLSGDEQQQLQDAITSARDDLLRANVPGVTPVNLGATVAEAEGSAAIGQKQASVVAAPSTDVAMDNSGLPVAGASLGILQVVQPIEAPGYPKGIPPGPYLVRAGAPNATTTQALPGGWMPVELVSPSGARYVIPGQPAQVRGRPLAGDQGEERLAIVVNLWMVLCFFGEDCDGG